MKIRFLFAFILIVAPAALFLSGCNSADPDETSVPWSRPAQWENSAPGFGMPAYRDY